MQYNFLGGYYMFIEQFNNHNQSPAWNNVPMYRELPMAPVSPITNNPLYTQGWLSTQIGKFMTISFLIGTGTYQDRSGILQEVGISFVTIKDANTNDITMCDIYSIKFVTVYHNQIQNKCMP
jgi:hypothetical protein